MSKNAKSKGNRVRSRSGRNGSPSTSRRRRRRTSSTSRRKSQRPLFPTAQMHGMLCGNEPLDTVGHDIPVFMTAVQQYIAQEILERAHNKAVSGKSDEITSEDIIAVLQENEDFNDVFDSEIIENEINRLNEE